MLRGGVLYNSPGFSGTSFSGNVVWSKANEQNNTVILWMDEIGVPGNQKERH